VFGRHSKVERYLGGRGGQNGGQLARRTRGYMASINPERELSSVKGLKKRNLNVGLVGGEREEGVSSCKKSLTPGTSTGSGGSRQGQSILYRDVKGKKKSHLSAKKLAEIKLRRDFSASFANCLSSLYSLSRRICGEESAHKGPCARARH